MKVLFFLAIDVNLELRLDSREKQYIKICDYVVLTSNSIYTLY